MRRMTDANQARVHSIEGLGTYYSVTEYVLQRTMKFCEALSLPPTCGKSCSLTESGTSIGTNVFFG